MYVQTLFDLIVIFQGALISNTSSFPYSVLGYDVLSTTPFAYGDMDCELKFGIWENSIYERENNF
jgi:hypothetical protein